MFWKGSWKENKGDFFKEFTDYLSLIFNLFSRGNKYKTGKLKSTTVSDQYDP